MVVYSIKDLEKLTGVKAHTIRIWEKRHKILDPKRTAGNVRYYNDEDLKLILNIALLNRNGIKISKIAGMETCEIQKKVAELVDIDESFEGQLDTLTISLIDLDEEKFLKIFNKNIEERGFGTTMLDVIYPFLDKLAVMWITGSIKSIHEKFVSNLIKRKCIVEIDKLRPSKEQCFLIYLPPGESNELSLLFLHYLIAREGYKVINAGIDVEVNDLIEAVNIRCPEFLFTIINESMGDKEIERYIHELKEIFANTQILLSGIKTASLGNKSVDKVHLLNSSEDTVSFLQSINN